MENETHVTQTKETVVEKKTVIEEPPKPEPRRGETIVIETHTEN